MLSSSVLLRSSVNCGLAIRNLGSSLVVLQKATDPIQQLFADKVKEYAQKKNASGGKLVDASKDVEANLQLELEKVAQAYGGGAGIDMSKFPSFRFTDPALDDVLKF